MDYGKMLILACTGQLKNQAIGNDMGEHNDQVK
jgi:hypothetical protein